MLTHCEGWNPATGQKVALRARTVSEAEREAERQSCTAYGFCGATYRKLDGEWCCTSDGGRVTA